MADGVDFSNLAISIEVGGNSVTDVIFNDYDVTVEIYDSVIAKWVLTDYAETNPSSASYLRSRDLIQPKLKAGTGVVISVDNEISADFGLEADKLISRDADNEVKLGTDQLLYVGFGGLLRDGGDVATREDLPDTSEAFIAHMILDENLIVFSYLDATIGLVWLPLSFFADMSLYVLKEELDADVALLIEAHNDDEEAHPFILNALEEATVADVEMSDTSIRAVQNKVVKAYVDTAESSAKAYVDGLVGDIETLLAGV